MKLLNTTNMDIINNCRQYFDIKLPSILSDLIVSEGLRKSPPNVTNFFLQNFSLSSIVYIYLLVKFLFFGVSVFSMFICYQLWWIRTYIYNAYLYSPGNPVATKKRKKNIIILMSLWTFNSYGETVISTLIGKFSLFRSKR